MAAELIVSALLPVLIDKLVSETSKTIARYNGIGADIKKWQRWLKQIQRALADASEKEITDDDVKEWLKDLQLLAYDVEDLFDGWATEAMHPEVTHDSEASTNMVRKLIPTCCPNFSRRTTMLAELYGINARFKDLVNRKNEFGFKGEGKPGLKVEGELRPKNTNQSSSVIDPSRIVGRQDEKEALVQQLLGGGPSDQKYSIVPIVGMGGIGKTTLASFLYNEEQVNAHFELKAWVVVSDEFDSFAISKAIYENVSEGNKTFSDLNMVQVHLVKQLRGKRVLLVLDDVWCESKTDWAKLVEPFHVCAPGSKIIITTRKEQLLRRLGYNDLSPLQSLSHEDALSLFARHALGVNNFDSHLPLKPHGEAIVKKCGGLPLALIALGASLMTKEDETSWRGVVNSEIWTSEDCDIKKIIPALRLSYHDLSSHLKQLFAYCSLFPKDFLFDKEELVQLWMAEGFLTRLTPNNPTEERLGLTSFDELLSRTFFQHASDNKSLFVMHDMMNDLATFVADEFFVRLGIEEKKDIGEKMFENYRHMSFVREEYVAYQKFEGFEKAKRLRTLLATSVGVVNHWQSFYLSNKILVDLLPKLPFLRVLCLSRFNISEVPESIDTLRQLRYLNLSRTKIKHLPENVCNLYNLQTLIVLGCFELVKLPNTFLQLKNLRHLDIRDTKLLNQMPLLIGELKNLQSLSKIIIGVGSLSEISTLKELMNLCGKVYVVGLDKVKHVTRAWEGNFLQKRPSELEIHWSCLLVGSPHEVLVKEVLDEVKPYNEYLQQLTIDSYAGLEFPVWVGDPSFLLRLKSVAISNCENCTSLPPLGQLPALKELSIIGLAGVEVVGLELLGAGVAFRSLEILQFSCMNGWKKWSTNSEAVFPCLQHLYMNDCPNLVEVSLKALLSLNVLEISKCDSGVLRRLVQVAPSVTRLDITDVSGLDDVVWRGFIEYLGAVENLSINCCDEIRYLWESEAVVSTVLVKLKNLKMYKCGNLVSLGEKEDEEDNCRSNLLTSFRSLEVYGCNNMLRCSCPDSIEMLDVFYCNSITAISIPTGGQKLKKLAVNCCNKLLERGWGELKMNNNNNRSGMPMLEDMYIYGWPYKKLMIELNSLVHLTKLRMIDCESLESFPGNNLTSLMELEIRNCSSMDVCGAWPPNLRSLDIGKLKKPILEWGSQKFPTSLVKLVLWDDDGVSSCSQISHLLPSSLTRFCIHRFEKLESVSMGLQHLTSLQNLYFYKCPNLNNLFQLQQPTSSKHLCFEYCPNLPDLPELLLPSLLSLKIKGCPKLQERCSKRGSYWPLISHIPCIKIHPGYED